MDNKRDYTRSRALCVLGRPLARAMTPRIWAGL